MSTNQERDDFLADQAQRFGEPILAFALGRVLEGPPLGSEMVFLLVGPSALYLVPSVRDASLFGFSLPSRKPVALPEPLTLPKERASYSVRSNKGLWALLAGPQEVVVVNAENSENAEETSSWKFQLVGGAEAFVAAWKAAWTLRPDANQ